jgi:hypothetical protein
MVIEMVLMVIVQTLSLDMPLKVQEASSKDFDKQSK